MAAELEVARQLTYAAAVRLESVHPWPIVHFCGRSAAAKCFGSSIAMTSRQTRFLLSGSGYVRDHPAERMMQDAKVTLIYEGTNPVQRLMAGHRLLLLLIPRQLRRPARTMGRPEEAPR